MKKKIFALLALVCMTLTASADVVPTYALTKATDAEAHGTITFKVGENTVTSAAEGQTVTVAIEPNTGWSVGGLQGLWYAGGVAKAPKRVLGNIDLLKDFELEPVEGNPNAFTFVMKRANAEISVSYVVDQNAPYKEALQTAIAIASNINPEALADAIAAAQAAMTAEDATAESLTQANQTLEAAIKTYFGEVLPNLGAIVTALNEETLNTAYADADAALAKEDVTLQELVAAMQGIITAAQAVAPEHLQNLKGYAVKYGATDAATLVDNALAAIEAGNVAQIIATMTAVKEAATPLAQTVLGTMKNYVEAFGLTEQAAQAQAALDGGNYITMITTAKALFTHLIAAAKEYLPKLGAIAEGLNDETLNSAYAAAQELLAKESITPEELGAAMQNIIAAAKAVAPEHLQNLKGYAEKYGATDAATLIDAALAAIEAGNVSQIIATMTAVKEAATPLAQTVLGTMKTYVQQFGLTEQAAQAQAALDGGNYITMITTAKELFSHLIAAAKEYLPKLGDIATGLNDETLNTAYAAAQALLAKESITPEELAAAMQNIITAAQAVAPEHLQNLKGYAVKYGATDAATLVDNALAAIEAGNVSQIIAAMTAVKEAATPLAQQVLSTMKNYVEAFGLTEQATQAQAALEGGNYITMITTAKALFTHLIAAAKEYLPKLGDIATGLNDETLNTAYAAAQELLAKESITPEELATAMQNIIAAAQAVAPAHLQNLKGYAEKYGAEDAASLITLVDNALAAIEAGNVAQIIATMTAVKEAATPLAQTVLGTMKTYVQQFGLTEQAAQAQAALDGGNYITMITTAKELFSHLIAAAKEYLPKLGAIAEGLNDETLNTAYAAAQALLAKESITPEELAAAMQNIITAAKAVAPEHLQNLKGYAEKYGATDAATLIDAALAAIEAGNVAQIIATMTAVKEAATPLAQTVLGTMKTYVQQFGLTDLAAQAQAALDGGNYITMITTAKELFSHLIAAAKEYLPKLGAIAEGLNDETLNTAYAAAQELLAKESITPEELAAAMQNIITAAQAVAPEHLQNLKGYAVKYGATDAATLVDNALAAIEAGNVAQIIATMTAVKEAATPLAQQVLGTMIGYVQAFGLTEQAAQAQAALDGGNYITMITTAKELFTHLIAAAKEYLPKLGDIATGLNDETLNTAYAAAQELLAKESITPEELAAAMQNIITAAQAVAPEHLQNLKGYAEKYGATDAATLIDAALAAIEAGNVSQIIATMTAVKTAATPLAQQVLGTMIGYVQAFGLTEQATQAQAALEGGNYITMITTAKALFTHLIAAAKEYLPKLGAIVEGLNDETLNTAYAAAQELLAKESITPEELATAMQNIITAAKAVAPEHLQNLKGYAVKYGAEDAASLITLIDNALAAIEAGNVSQIIATMTAVKEAATPLAQTVLGTMKTYVQQFGLTDLAAQAQAALEGGNYITMITTAKALFTHLIAAAKEYLPKLGAIAEGLNDETLNTAYAAAQELLAKESITPEELAAAMQNIITAAQAVAPEHLQNLKGYAVKYGATDAASLITLVDNALAAIEAGNVAQIIATMTAVKEAATPLAQTVLGTMKTYVQAFGLTEQATQAQAALEGGNYITMITTAKALFTHLIAAAKEYLPKLGAIVEGLNDETLNTAYAAAQELLAKESITPEELAAAMQNIITAAKAVAPEHLQNLKGYAEKYGAEDAASLITLIDNALAAIEAGNVAQIIAAMTAVKTAATPLAQQVLGTMIGYVQAFGLTEQATQAQAALEGGNYITMITTAKALFTHLIAAAKEYLPKLGAIAEGLNDETLNTAYAAAQELLAKESITPEELAAAMQNIITAAKAVAPEHLQNLKGYAEKYGATDAATLIDAALAAIEAGNVSQIIATMTAVKEAATPLAQTVLGTMKTYVQQFGLTDLAAQAQAALEGGNYITMITTAKELFSHLIAAAKEYLPKLGAIAEGLNDETLNTAYAAAQALLAKESITPEELAAAMQNIITAAKAVAPEHLQNLKGYAEKYGATDAATLIDAALAAIEAGNVAQIIATMTAVKEAATPLAQTVLGTMKTYVQQFGLTDLAAQAQAALDGGNYITMITTAKELFSHLIAAAKEYLPKLGDIATGLNDETLNTAYAAAQALLAKESITPEELAAAMQNIITAAQAVAPEHLQNLKGYAVKYGAEDAASLITLVDNALAAIEAGNVAQIIATMTAVKEAATPLATAILTQMIEKAQSYTGFEEDITEAQAALASGNYITMITAAKALYAKLQAVVTGVGSMKAAFEKDVWYDLNGHKLNGKPTKKGVYFINGKKVVI